MQNPKKKGSAPEGLFSVEDLISGICSAAVQVQRSFETLYEKQAIHTKLQFDKNRLPLNTNLTRIALPDKLNLTSFKVESNVDFKTLSNSETQVVVSIFGRPLSALFEARYAREQYRRHKLTVEVETVPTGSSNTQFEKEDDHG